MPENNPAQSPLADLQQSVQWIDEIRKAAEPFLNTDSARQALQEIMSTPEGQKLYYHTQEAFYGHAEAINHAAGELKANLTDKGVIQNTAGTAGAAAVSPAPGTSRAVAQLQEANRTLSEVQQAAASAGGGAAGGSAAQRTSQASGKTAQAGTAATPAPAPAPSKSIYNGGDDYKCGTPEQCANTQVNSSMVSYIENAKSPLNSSNITQADYMVVSQLAYMPKTVPNSTQPYQRGVNGESKTVGQYCQELLDRMETQMKNHEKVDAADYQFAKAMVNSPRYSNLKLDSVVPYHDGNVDTNVVCIDIGNGQGLIGIQGTNGTVQDWVNNAQFSSTDPSREEQHIIRNIEELTALNGYDGIYLTGHSQGGRDATSAAVFSNDETRSKVREVYNLDGPGYRNEMLEKYREEFDAMAGKIHNVYPNGSFVGQIYTPVGDKTYLESKGDGVYAYLHSPFNWEVNPETGEPVPANVISVQYVFSWMVNGAMDYVGSKLSPEQTDAALSVLMRLGYDDKDVTKFEFGNILNHLDEISTGDALVLANAVATVYLSAVSDYCDYIDKACTVIGKIATLVGAPEIAAVCETIKGVVGVVKKVCDVVCWVLKKIAEIRARRQAEERANYKASNPDMTFVCQALADAAAHLEMANKQIIQADRDCDGIRRGFVEESIIDEIVSWISSPFSSIAGLFNWFRIGVTDLLHLHNQPCLKKGVRCCNLLVEEGTRLMQSVPYAESDREFRVTPSALSSCASDGADAVKQTKQQFTTAEETISGLKSVWQGDDFDSLKAKTTQEFQAIQEQMNNLANGFGIMSTAASVYDSFQDRCIQEFQAAAQ